MTNRSNFNRRYKLASAFEIKLRRSLKLRFEELYRIDLNVNHKPTIYVFFEGINYADNPNGYVSLGFVFTPQGKIKYYYSQIGNQGLAKTSYELFSNDFVDLLKTKGRIENLDEKIDKLADKLVKKFISHLLVVIVLLTKTKEYKSDSLEEIVKVINLLDKRVDEAQAELKRQSVADDSEDSKDNS